LAGKLYWWTHDRDPGAHFRNWRGGL